MSDSISSEYIFFKIKLNFLSNFLIEYKIQKSKNKAMKLKKIVPETKAIKKDRKRIEIKNRTNLILDTKKTSLIIAFTST